MINPEEGNNAKLAYDYTESTLKSVTASYDAVTTKLNTVVGFSGVLLKFAADLSNQDWLIIVKVLVCGCLIIAMLACGIGLWPRSSGKNLANPSSFLDKGENNIYNWSEEKCRVYIARAWSNEIKAVTKNRSFRVRWLSIAIIFLALAIIGFVVSILQTGFTAAAK